MSGNTSVKADFRLFARVDCLKYGAGTLGKRFSDNEIINLAARPDLNVFIGGRLTSDTTNPRSGKGAIFEADAGMYVGSQFGICTDAEVYKPVHTFGDKRNEITGIFNAGIAADVSSDVITAAITDSHYIPYRVKANADLGYGVTSRSDKTNNEWRFVFAARAGVVQDGFVTPEGIKNETSVLVTPVIKVEYRAEINANSGQTVDIFANIDATGGQVGARINLKR